MGNLGNPLLAFEGLPESWGSEASWQGLPIVREHTDMKAQNLPVLCLPYHFRMQVMYSVHVILQFITVLQQLQKAELALCGRVLQLSYSLNMCLHIGKEWQKNIPFWKSQPVQTVTQCRTGVNWPSRMHSYLYLLWHGNKWYSFSKASTEIRQEGEGELKGPCKVWSFLLLLFFIVIQKILRAILVPQSSQP